MLYTVACHQSMSSFEGVWAVHTTVIIAADRREARSELGAALGDPESDAVIFAHLLRFPTNL